MADARAGGECCGLTYVRRNAPARCDLSAVINFLAIASLPANACGWPMSGRRCRRSLPAGKCAASHKSSCEQSAPSMGRAPMGVYGRRRNFIARRSGELPTVRTTKGHLAQGYPADRRQALSLVVFEIAARDLTRIDERAHATLRDALASRLHATPQLGRVQRIVGTEARIITLAGASNSSRERATVRGAGRRNVIERRDVQRRGKHRNGHGATEYRSHFLLVPILGRDRIRHTMPTN